MKNLEILKNGKANIILEMLRITHNSIFYVIKQNCVWIYSSVLIKIRLLSFKQNNVSSAYEEMCSDSHHIFLVSSYLCQGCFPVYMYKLFEYLKVNSLNFFLQFIKGISVFLIW